TIEDPLRLRILARQQAHLLEMQDQSGQRGTVLGLVLGQEMSPGGEEPVGLEHHGKLPRQGQEVAWWKPLPLANEGERPARPDLVKMHDYLLRLPASSSPTRAV